MKPNCLAEQGVTNFVFLGEAGCGKSEISLNVAIMLGKAQEKPVHFFDLDMTKPLFRSRDAAKVLEKADVTVHFVEQFMDTPVTVGGLDCLLRMIPVMLSWMWAEMLSVLERLGPMPQNCEMIMWLFTMFLIHTVPGLRR